MGKQLSGKHVIIMISAWEGALFYILLFLYAFVVLIDS